MIDTSEEKNDPLCFINPDILTQEGEFEYKEGCLSVPNFYEKVTRPGHITVKALNRDGVEFEMVRTGDGGKNLTSAHENQILGRYIRHRLGVAPGGLIEDAALERKNYFGLSFYPKGLDKFFVQFNNSKISKSI